MADDVVYAWPVKSDHGTTTYEVILRHSGALECPCPGWIFARKDKFGNTRRTCKHVERLGPQAADIIARISRGEVVERPEQLDARIPPAVMRRRPEAIRAVDLSVHRRRAIND